jgi:type II secretory pathway component PulF
MTTDASPEPSATTPVAASQSAAPPRPPVRWGGVVWGLLLVVFPTAVLFVLSAPERLAAVEVWLAALTPGTAWALWLAAIGLLIVVFSLLGVIRSAQRRRRAA